MKVDIDIVPYSEEHCVCVEYVPVADIQLVHEFGGLTVRANSKQVGLVPTCFSI